MADTPSPEALRIADETVAEWCDMHGGSGPDCDPSFDELTTSVALALDRFAAARVEAERERLAAALREPDDVLRRELRDNFRATALAMDGLATYEDLMDAVVEVLAKQIEARP